MINKKFLLLGILLSSVVFSACLKKDTDMAANAPDNMKDATEVKEESGSMDNLIGMNKTQKCTWDAGEDGNSVVYTDGKKSRMEAKAPVNQNSELQYMFMINDGDWVYTWDDATKKGMKMNVAEMEKNQEEYEDIDYGMPDMDDFSYEDESEDSEIGDEEDMDIDIKCEKWKADPKMFIPPTDVEFQNISEIMNGIKDGMSDMKAVCNMLEGEDKEECIEGFAEAESNM